MNALKLDNSRLHTVLVQAATTLHSSAKEDQLRAELHAARAEITRLHTEITQQREVASAEITRLRAEITQQREAAIQRAQRLDRLERVTLAVRDNTHRFARAYNNAAPSVVITSQAIQVR